ncbi:MAG: CBS domain-containing protein [Candidatus Aenigmatarchaeota archaeon]
MKKVRDFMNSNVICVSSEDSIFEAAKIFCEKNISGAPVLEEGKVVGVISISDIIKFVSMKLQKSDLTQIPSLSLLLFDFIKSSKEYLQMKKEINKILKVKVKDVMTKEVITISPEASLIEAASLMEKNDVNRLPVIENDKLVGIIAREDLIKALIE